MTYLQSLHKLSYIKFTTLSFTQRTELPRKKQHLTIYVSNTYHKHVEPNLDWHNAPPVLQAKGN
jgi:hypothetical protein